MFKDPEAYHKPVTVKYHYDKPDDFKAEFRTPKEIKDNDPVDRPAHYMDHPSGFECIQVTRWFNFNLGNVIKYIWRSEKKGKTVEDLKKARFYLEDEILRREGL